MKTLYTENLVGKKFNSLLCIDFLKRDKHGVAWCLWKCDCGNEIKSRAPDVVLGKKKSCRCLLYRKGKENPNWNGYEGITGNLWSQIKRGTKRKTRILDLNITIEDVWDLYQFQNGMCALSGIKLSLLSGHKDRNYTASLDRIDSSKGYIKGNVQWVHKDINRMKQEFSAEKFLNLCKQITDYQVLKK